MSQTSKLQAKGIYCVCFISSPTMLSVWGRKHWRSLFPYIWIPSCSPQGTSKVWLSLSETLWMFVWVCVSMCIERLRRKLMFCFNRRGQRSNVSIVTRSLVGASRGDWLDCRMTEIIWFGIWSFDWEVKNLERVRYCLTLNSNEHMVWTEHSICLI